MAVSKKLRFEVFKRDRFTCQYCGNRPPQVVLELDHVIPSSRGGNDEEENLVTSCHDCNSGKSDRSLAEAPQALQERMVEKQERLEQLEAYNAFLMDVRERESAVIDDLGRYWFNKFMARRDKYTFGDARVPSIRTFLKHLPPAEILEAMDIAHAKRCAVPERDEQTWSYFCGVCWRKVEERAGR
jgi:hypothetical protein